MIRCGRSAKPLVSLAAMSPKIGLSGPYMQLEDRKTENLLSQTISKVPTRLGLRYC